MNKIKKVPTCLDMISSPYLEILPMHSKPLTLLLILFLLFPFSGNGFVFGEEPEVKREYWGEGKLKSERHYKDGKADGFLTIWHKNGRKHFKTHFKDGKKDGLAASWYPDGKKRYEKNYKNGKENGRFTIWYQNGQKHCAAFSEGRVEQYPKVAPKAEKKSITLCCAIDTVETA